MTQNLEELENFCNIKQLQIKAEVRFLDVLVVNFLWDKFDFSTAFKKSLGPNEKISTVDVAKILTINRFLNPASKIKTIAWLNKTMLPKIMGICAADYTKSKIFRELENIHGSKDDLEKLMWDFSSRFKSGDFDVYFFDGTTSWFEGNKCTLAKNDLEKTRGIYPHVVSLILVTDKSGYPIAWDVENGNIKDVTCFSKIVKRLYFKHGVKRITLCYDRGIASKENFELPSEVECKFISGIKDNQIKQIFDLNSFNSTKKIILKNLIKTNENGNRRIASISGFTSNDKNIWFKDLGIIGQYRYIVSFNIEACKVEKVARENRLKKFLEFVSKKNDELKLAKKSRDFNITERDLLEAISKYKINGIIEYKLLPIIAEKKYNSFQIECSLDKAKLADLELTDGIMVYITDHIETDPNKGVVLSASDITAYYKRKYIIENSFRELKSFLDLRPFHVWKEQHVRAHYDLAIIGYFIRVHIARTLELNAD
jgi:transposase